MNQYRIAQLEKNLERQYRLLAAAENGINQAQSTVAAEKYQIEIEDDIRPKIRVYEEEYFQNLQQLASTVTFRETEAQTVINIITQNVEQVKQQKTQYPNNLEELLKRIEEKLNEPQATADAKLKGTLSLLPPFINLSYDCQLDTENLCRKYFPTFSNLVKNAKKK